MKRCAYCGRENQDDATRCRECATEFVAGSAQTRASARYEKVAVLHDEIEAQRLALELNRLRVPHVIVSYGDAAFGHIYQTSKGWGRVDAPEEHENAVLSILADLRKSPPVEPQSSAVQEIRGPLGEGGTLSANDDVNGQMLAELRRLRRSNQCLLYLVLALVAIHVFSILVSRDQRQLPARTASRDNPWTELAAAVNRFDYAKGLSLAQDIVARNPDDYYSHSYIARIYLTLGDLTNAEAHYARAAELWPSEENEKNLDAIRTRLARSRGKH